MFDSVVKLSVKIFKLTNSELFSLIATRWLSVWTSIKILILLYKSHHIKNWEKVCTKNKCAFESNNDFTLNLEKNFGSRQINLNLQSWFYNKRACLESAWEWYLISKWNTLFERINLSWNQLPIACEGAGMDFFLPKC